MSGHDHDQHHGAGHQHGHGHGHHHDQGWRGALRYLRHAPRMWHNPVNDAVVDLAAPRKGETVVDIGAGMGRATVIAAKRGAAVIAADPTPFMRRVLQLRRLARRQRARITVIDGAAEAVDLDDGQADAVLSLNTMHHWTDPDRAAQELYRILRPGGRLVLVDEDFDDPAHALHDPLDDHHERHEMHMVDVDAMATRLEAAGFQAVDASHAEIGGQPCRRILASK